jgi:hypothetical protein
MSFDSNIPLVEKQQTMDPSHANLPIWLRVTIADVLDFIQKHLTNLALCVLVIILLYFIVSLRHFWYFLMNVLFPEFSAAMMSSIAGLLVLTLVVTTVLCCNRFRVWTKSKFPFFYCYRLKANEFHEKYDARDEL